ncbi:hypothetical protein BRYFOR_06150 [Marvinbryantia formatexigens DSM 14469]|uniref:Uncharacterized protein n=1 Tax=Marvinbryantia formatexigens DSM 14469 TaxID=478749 RepID=C6LC03_9FIRM|nr:hypothetical protein BRYFOR_06150 [Marvinbryantia formatexigens DSM 14469]
MPGRAGAGKENNPASEAWFPDTDSGGRFPDTDSGSRLRKTGSTGFRDGLQVLL